MIEGLRIKRRYEWVLDIPVSEIRFGGNNPLSLHHVDTLQYCIHEEWFDAPIVEEQIPEHPYTTRNREKQESIAKTLKNIVDKLK